MSIAEQPTDREEWLQRRRKCLGASEVATILGLNEFATPYDVWASKVHDVRRESSQAAELGHVLQPGIAAYASRQLGLTLTSEEDFSRHPVHDWAGATTDYTFVDSFGGTGILEIKATRESYWPEIPNRVLTQAAWQSWVKGIDRVLIGTLHASTRFELYEFDFTRDATWFGDVFEACREWWQKHVVGGQPPSGFPRSDLAAAIRATAGKRIELDEQDYFVLGELADLKRQRKAIDDSIKARETILKARLGDAEIADYCGKTVLTWKQSKARQTFDEAAFKARHGKVWAKYVRTVEGSRMFLSKLKGGEE